MTSRKDDQEHENARALLSHIFYFYLLLSRSKDSGVTNSRRCVHLPEESYAFININRAKDIVRVANNNTLCVYACARVRFETTTISISRFLNFNFQLIHIRLFFFPEFVNLWKLCDGACEIGALRRLRNLRKKARIHARRLISRKTRNA